MTDKTKLILSILVICIGLLLGTGERLWWSKLGWFFVGGGVSALLFLVNWKHLSSS